MTKRLVALISTKGKTPEKISAEANAAIQKYQTVQSQELAKLQGTSGNVIDLRSKVLPVHPIVSESSNKTTPPQLEKEKTHSIALKWIKDKWFIIGPVLFFVFIIGAISWSNSDYNNMCKKLMRDNNEVVNQLNTLDPNSAEWNNLETQTENENPQLMECIYPSDPPGFYD
jgi:hypothetical protein